MISEVDNWTQRQGDHVVCRADRVGEWNRTASVAIFAKRADCTPDRDLARSMGAYGYNPRTSQKALRLRFCSARHRLHNPPEGRQAQNVRIVAAAMSEEGDFPCGYRKDLGSGQRSITIRPNFCPRKSFAAMRRDSLRASLRPTVLAVRLRNLTFPFTSAATR